MLLWTLEEHECTLSATLQILIYFLLYVQMNYINFIFESNIKGKK